MQDASDAAESFKSLQALQAASLLAHWGNPRPNLGFSYLRRKPIAALRDLLQQWEESGKPADFWQVGGLYRRV